MTENNQANVYAAFETLLEELEAQIDTVNSNGAAAFAERDYDRARGALDRAGQLTEFRGKITALRTEWQEVTGVRLSNGALIPATNEQPATDEQPATPELVTRRSSNRLQRGLRTPEPAYYQPILQALHSLGGRANMNDVLDRVKELMQGTLTEYDYQPLNSDPEVPRWRNAAQWARNAMVKEGLLKTDSPRGTWEISDGGRQLLIQR